MRKSTTYASHFATGQDLWIKCNTTGNHQLVTSTLCALYFLPEYFKLIIKEGHLLHGASAKHYDLMDRIHIGSKNTELATRKAPFVFVYDDVMTAQQSKSSPAIVISASPEQDARSHEWGGFIVPADHPEALASTLLCIARSDF